jgi:CHAT domain-containing protein/Tfp pilus assembly protein PilF
MRHPPARRIRILFVLFFLAGLAGCQTTVDRQQATGVVAAFGAGKNLLDEPCRVASKPTDKNIPEVEGVFELFCGRWEEPSARIVLSNNAAPLDQLATRGIWRTSLNALAVCKAPVSTVVLGDVPALSLDCAMRRGGWPYQALVTRLGKQTFLSESIPAAAPVVERALAVLSGRRDSAEGAEGELSAEISGLEARVDAKLYSAGDISGYRDLLRLAQYYNYSGLYPEAEKRYRQALELQQKVLSTNNGGLAFVLMSLALELSNQERFAEADSLFSRAEAVVPFSFDPTDESRLMSYRAIHYANQRRFGRALDFARRATEMRTELARNFRPDLFGAATDFAQQASFMSVPGAAQPLASENVLVGRAETALGDVVQSKYVEGAMLLKQGKLDDADQAFAKARSILELEPRVPRRWLPQIQWLQALTAERRGRLDAAESLLRQSIEAQKRESAGSRNEGLALIALGRVYAAQNRATEAFAAFHEGFGIIKEQGGGLRFREALPYFRLVLAEAERKPDDRQPLFNEMFAVGQLVRESATAQTIALAAARLSASKKEIGTLIRNLQDARRRRDTLKLSLVRARTDPAVLAPQLEALEKQADAIGAEVADLERQVQAAAPRYNQLIDAPVTLDQVTDALGADEALWQILVGDETSVGFFVDRDGVEAYAIDLGERQAREFVSQLRAPFDTILGAPFDVPKSHDLFVRLLGPVSERLANAKHLITVPSGPLLSLPFGVLVTEPQDPVLNDDYSAVAWLARRQAITLAPSVQSFINLRTNVQPSRATKELIGFGNFVPKRDAEVILRRRGLPEACRPEIVAVANMPPLPNTAAELKSVAASLGHAQSELVLGSNFTEEAVKEADLADYRVIYFATHALLPFDFTCWPEPMLVTSTSPGPDAKDDGLLVSSEVLELNLDADLVVLSACNTGGPGGETGGESLSGLARAFFYAGARSLMVTHWQIPDAPTVALMTKVFEGLSTGTLTAAEAMKRGQIAMIEQPRFSHPLNWAAFSVIGDGGQRPGAPNLAARASATPQ